MIKTKKINDLLFKKILELRNVNNNKIIYKIFLYIIYFYSMSEF